MFILSCIIMLRLTFQSRRFSFSGCGSKDSCSVSWPISFFPSFVMWLYNWTLLLHLIPSFLRRRCKEKNPTSRILDRIPFGGTIQHVVSWWKTCCLITSSRSTMDLHNMRPSPDPSPSNDMSTCLPDLCHRNN